MQNLNEKFDVIICGAGPAGSTCALALGESGLKVALIDKSSFPRDKVCGDAVMPYVPKVLNSIHPKYSQAIQAFTEKEKINAMRFVAPNKKKLDFVFDNEGFISTRINFDNFLFEQAAVLPNVKVFLNTVITDVMINEASVSITTNENLNLEAALVIGCDGAHSIVSKKCTDTKMDLNHYSGAVRAYFKNVKDIPNNTIEFHFFKDLIPGYFWIFPLPNNLSNVGFGLVSENISTEKMNLREKMQEIIETEPDLKERFANAEMQGSIKGYGLPLGSRKVTISGKRFMLCGDAASLIDPLSGEGIGEAIISGRYAGWQAKKCFDENNFSAEFMKQYDKNVYDKLWKHHQARYLFRKLVNKRAWLLNAFANLGNANKIFYKALSKFFN